MPINSQENTRKGCLFMKYEAEFRLLLSDLKKRQEKANEEYADCLSGTLHMENRKGKNKFLYVYEENGKRKRRVINEKQDLLAALCRKRYLEEELGLISRDINSLKRFISTYIQPTPETIISRLPDKYRNLPDKYFFNPHQVQGTTPQEKRDQDQDQEQSATYRLRQRWATEPYDQSTHKQEQKVQLTSRGLKVRTKSEVVIAEMLDAAGIFYRYEQMIYIEDFSFAPDFTILTDRGTIYWEHAGMIHDEEYCNHHKWKLSMYEKAGIVPWKNLIVTYDTENGGLDTRIIRSEIENKLIYD